MDNMEPINLGELGRPTKFPRRELAETEDTNMIQSAEETTRTGAMSDGCICAVLEAEAFIARLTNAMDYGLPGLTFPPAPVEVAPAEEAPAPPADPDAYPGLPSTSAVRPRRRPRKGVPRRAPLF